MALVVNVLKRDARAACGEIVPVLKKRGVTVIADRETAGLLGDARMGRDVREIRAGADLVVTVGGDGTVLKAARIISGAGIPLLGINLGGLGFLTAATRDEAARIIAATLRGDYRAEERLLLRVTLVRRDGRLLRHLVLNDAVISRGALSRLVAMETWIDGDYLATFLSDGLIVATPTGSTAYSLSAGGPLVSPDTDAIIVTPICPHTLTNRPLIVPGKRKVRVAVAAKGRGATLTLDGQAGEALMDGDEIVVERYGKRLMLVASPEKSYFRLLREKLHWGGRAHHG